ncbi:hypothetical protein [Falsochrobactrum shanghaiense]|uniref:hypothetical protein n=1 Tax=Falsochrobactrum shanghaiense TaxID=2201899 RepID=UPI001FDEA650|nr:hypothetical protein [Falsochrobactrum shanghaiense]
MPECKKEDQADPEIQDINANEQIALDIKIIGNPSHDKEQGHAIKQTAYSLAAAPEQTIAKQQDTECINKGGDKRVDALIEGNLEHLRECAQTKQKDGDSKEKEMPAPFIGHPERKKIKGKNKQYARPYQNKRIRGNVHFRPI